MTAYRPHVYDLPRALRLRSIKAATNLVKHGVAFGAAEGFDFSTAMVEADILHSDVEDRLRAYVVIGDRLHLMVFTIRRPTVWIISLRKASNREIRRYASEG